MKEQDLHEEENVSSSILEKLGEGTKKMESGLGSIRVEN